MFGQAVPVGQAQTAAPSPPLTPPPGVTINNPPLAPHQILVFTQRSFVSASGYGPNDVVRVDVIHRFTGNVVSSQDIIPQDDPATPVFDGIVEVNHPGGGCWVNFTPDIRAGDRVRTTALDTVTGAVAVDETTVQAVTAQLATDRAPNGTPLAPGTVQVHGTAQDFNAPGTPLDIAALEQRLVIPGDQFDFNGRRTLRATAPASDGVLAYDAPGSIRWTATYTGLNGLDISRALGADSRIMWLGAVPGAGVEGTVFEAGAGFIKAPSPPCRAPLEVIPPPPGSETTPPTTPTLLTATVQGTNTVHLTWSASTDPDGPVANYGVFRNGTSLSNVSGTTLSYDDVNVPPGTYTYTVDAGDEVGNRSPQSNALSATTTFQVAVGTVHEPPVAPIQLIAFPSRDFISNSGFLATDTVTAQVIRNGFVISTASGLIPQDDPSTPVFDGIVEVNHPGGGCWEGVTPDIRVGDKIRTLAFNQDGTLRTADQTTVANVVAGRPTDKDPKGNPLPTGMVQIHGIAMDADGNAISAGPITTRLVAPRQLFDINGRRTLRAGGAGTDGTFVFDADDPTGVHWTAMYTGLDAADVTRALGAESRILWLGATPLAATEITTYENAPDAAANGPTPPCFAPSEPFDTHAPSAPTLQAARSGLTDVQLTWTTATDDVQVYGYGVYRDGIRIRNVGATTTSFIDHNVQPGTHTYTVDAVDTASPGDASTPAATQGLPWGNRSLASNALSINLADATAPSVPLNLVATVNAANVTLTWSPSADDVAVASYTVYRAGVKIADVPASPAPSYLDAGLAIGTYAYTVDAVDGAGNRSAQSAATTAKVITAADTQAPTTPANFKAAVDARGKTVTLSWLASTDNVGVTSYGIYRNGTKLADVGGTTLTYSDANLPAGTYTYSVDAADSAGNRSAKSAPSTAAVANEPPLLPHFIQAFAVRDFVSASGYTASEGPVTVSVIRNGITVSTSEPVIPQDDPATPIFDGIVEVNHPGGGCWTVVTPHIRPGDIVRLTTAAGIPDQTTVANVTALRAIQTAPDAIQVHGTAQDALGKPIQIDGLRQRLVSTTTLFDFNGRRVLQASLAGPSGDDGSLAYDAPGSINWTATFTGLSSADVQRALDADSRIIWLGTNPTGFVENTFFENGTGIVGGPAAPCTAPAEPGAVASTTPAALTFANQQVGSTSATQNVTLSNSGTLPMTVGSVGLSNLNPGDFTLGPNTCTSAVVPAGGSCSVGVRFAPTATGARSATLVFQDDAPGIIQTVPLSGNGTAASQGAASLSPTSLSFAPQQVGTSSAPQNVTLTNAGAGALAVGSITSSSANFPLSANLCSGRTLSPGQNCVVSVVFKPAAQGASTASLSFTDSAPNSPQSVALGGNGVVVQLAAPSKPALAAASDSGTKGDGITNVNTPTFTGTAASGTSVNILSDGLKVGSGPITAGAYSITTSLLTDGTHALVAQAVDAAGNVSPNSAALNVTIDTVAPVATAPVMTMAAGSAVTINPTNFANSTVPVKLTWSATDAVGATTYQLQQKTDTLNNLITTTGTFSDVAPAPTSTSVTLNLALGQLLVARPIVLNSYTFQVRACDAAGNCSTFAAAPKFQMLPVDDSLTGPLLNGAGSIGYSGSWTVGAVAGAYNGSVHFTTATGANAKLNKVTYNVTADVVWIATRGPDRGIATVTVDGVSQTVDLYAPTVQAAQVVFASNGLRGGAQHTVQVTSTGTKNAASTGVRVDLDGFVAIR